MINIPTTKEINVTELKEDNKNPNIMSKKSFEALKKVISKYGFIVPIITNKDLVIADGHHRWKAAKELKMEKVPVIQLDVDEVDRRLLRQILNKLKGQHDSELDFEEYKFLLDENARESLLDLIPDHSNEINKLLKRIDQENIINEEEFVEVTAYERAKTKTKIKPGDIFQLGNHRLMCGDSIKEADVKRLMNEKKASISLTSPPYNAGDNALGGNKNKVDSKYESYDDSKTQDEWLTLVTDSLEIMINNSNYIFLNVQQLAGNKIGFIELLNKFRNNFVDEIIWFKGYGQPAAAKNVLNSRFEHILIYKDEEKPNRCINSGDFHGTIANVYEGNGNSKNEFSKIHAATFPLHLPSFLIMNFSKKEDIVLDVFGDTGTTLIACEQLNRICYMMELDPVYCQVIIDRWEKYTQKKAEKVN